MFSILLARDRRAAGFTVGKVAWRISVTPAVYRDFEAGTRWPDWDAYDRICRLYGWPQTFVASRQE
jgi:hypothetical protein